MATAGDIDLDSYTQLPLKIDGATKLLSIPNTSNTTSSDDHNKTLDLNLTTLQETLTTINTLHTNLKSLDTTTRTSDSPPSNSNPTSTSTSKSIPPPPSASNLTTQKRTAQITKLRDSATTSFKKSSSGLSASSSNHLQESLRLYTFAIEGACGRPAWEPVGLIREELSLLYRDRAMVHMTTRNWVEGWKDCEASVECKRPQGNGGEKGEKGKGGEKNGSVVVWGRGGRCLVEMGRYAEAIRWLERGVDCEGVALRQGEEAREVRILLEEARRKVEVVSTV